jgi:hypothetical protein
MYITEIASYSNHQDLITTYSEKLKARIEAMTEILMHELMQDQVILTKDEFVHAIPNTTALLILLDSKLLRARMEEVSVRV